MIAILYAVAMAVLVAYGVNLLWLSIVHARHDRLIGGPTRDAGTAQPRDILWPPVTVQIPLYNEAIVVERVINACANLTYPWRLLEIQVLDDSTDETSGLAATSVEAWRARGLDIVHIRRDHRTGFKAGALQNGLDKARGELVAIFDADFIPHPDFLERVVPAFEDQRVGMVQTRWGHLNADASLLTRIQAFALDAHFALEQCARNRAGYFMNFNGTAGIWRRQCIVDAGGWEGDTLAEDLDLSYRAQLKGWMFRFLGDVESPAELPVDLNSFRAQQFRWTKGAVETTLKVLRPLWLSPQPWRIKVAGALHLSAHVVFPFLALAAVLHAPLMMLQRAGRGPGEIYFAIMGLGLFGLLGFFLAQLLAQRALYPDWVRRTLFFPIFMAGSMGLAVNNTRAIWQALRGHSSPFERTPKYSVGGASWWTSRYADTRVSAVMFFEAALATYCVIGLVVITMQGNWTAVLFQALFALAFSLVTFFNVRLAWLGRRRS